MVRKINIGASFLGQALEFSEFGSNPHTPKLLILGGVHGNEIEGVWLALAMEKKWDEEFSFKNIQVALLANANPDGIAELNRLNGNGVDLNRNLPTEDWTAQALNPKYPPGRAAASEPETQALIRLIESINPCAILSLHSFKEFQININGVEKSPIVRKWAESFSGICQYPVTEDIGYPTPGSLGTYAGKERGIPTITLEIERGMPQAAVLEKFVPVMDEAVRFWNAHFAKKNTEGKK